VESVLHILAVQAWGSTRAEGEVERLDEKEEVHEGAALTEISNTSKPDSQWAVLGYEL